MRDCYYCDEPQTGEMYQDPCPECQGDPECPSCGGTNIVLACTRCVSFTYFETDLQERDMYTYQCVKCGKKVDHPKRGQHKHCGKFMIRIYNAPTIIIK